MATFPSGITFKSITLKTKYNNFATGSRSFKTIVRGTPAQQYEVVLRTSNLNDDDFRVMQSFIDSLDGKQGTFDLALPKYSIARGVATGSPIVSSSKAIGDTSIPVSGYTALVTGIAKDGDFIRFGNHSKVYQVKIDVNSDAGGETTLTINPGLLIAVPSTTAITVTNTPFNFRLLGDVQEFTATTRARFPSLELMLEETLL